jgi:hypothetical protein
MNSFVSNVPDFEEVLKSPISAVPISARAPDANSFGTVATSSGVGPSTRKSRKWKPSVAQALMAKVKKSVGKRSSGIWIKEPVKNPPSTQTLPVLGSTSTRGGFIMQ